MNRKTIPKRLSFIASLGIVGFAFALAMLPEIPQAFATTFTTTVIGWNIPNGTTLNNGLVALILPLVTMGAFGGLGIMLTEKGGSIIVTLALIGYVAGALAGMLSFPTSAGPTLIPFANVVIGAFLLGIWVWKGDG